MSKDTVHQCIDENIVSNGKRGITAQSLANTLHLLADEGGGAGTVMVKIGTLIPVEGEIIKTTLTAEERAHNVEIFNAVKEAAANGEAMPVITFDILALYASVVPEIASRNHIENITIVLDELLTKANMKIEDITAVNLPKKPNTIAIIAASPITHTEATLVIPTTEVFSPYVVFAGPPINPAKNVATPSPNNVLSNPGSLIKSLPTLSYPSILPVP